jgi:hypothetical protein
MKSNTNAYLQSAKNTKNDEFYTTMEEIERELSNYTDQFYGQTVLCNCDDPFESNFSKYFIQNFNRLQLKRLICTTYVKSKVAGSQLSIFDIGVEESSGLVFDISSVNEEDLKTKEIRDIVLHNGVRKLQGDGDFSSDECVAFLEEADIVVTNPPFSQFRNFISLLLEYKKKFLVIGNMNAITYKEIFPIVQNNEAWLGYHNGDMAFRVPADSEPRKTRFWIDETGQKWRSLGNAMWFTNLDVSYRHKWMELTSTYSPERHTHFDNYDAINVSRVADIPMDYEGIMAVPLTILTKFNPDQFEIVGEANHGSDNPYDLFKPLINGKEIFKRILIRKKKKK